MRETIRQAIKCGPVPVMRDWRSLPTAELTRAERVMRFIEMLAIPEGHLVGQRITLHDFQQAFIYAIYDNPHGTRRAIYSVGRKNGKSAIVAGILLAHLVGPEARQNSQIVSGAMSRDQASLIFALACKMIQQTPRIADLVRVVPSSKRLIGLPMNVEYKALAADGKTAMGLSPVLVLIDEMGQITGPRSDFIDAITTASGAHKEALTITLSTQAANDADMLSMWIDDAEKSKDRKTVCHVYAAPEGAALMDEAGWRMSNPALGIFRDEEDLREQMARAERMPSSEPGARNLLLNQRVSTHAPFVSLNVWKENGGKPDDMDGFALYGGLDLSARTDLTAFVLVGVRDDVVSVWPYFWTPEQGLKERADRDRQPYDVWVRQGFLRTTPGATVNYDYVISDILDIIGQNEISAIAFDRWRIDVFKRDCERIGVEMPLVPFGQGFKDMAPAVDRLEEVLLNGQIRHDMHPVLTMCAANAAIAKDPAGNRKFEKARSTGRIDGMVALAMALGAAQTELDDTAAFADFLANPIGR